MIQSLELYVCIMQVTVGGIPAGKGSFTVVPGNISPDMSFVSPGNVTAMAGLTSVRQIFLRVS